MTNNINQAELEKLTVSLCFKTYTERADAIADAVREGGGQWIGHPAAGELPLNEQGVSISLYGVTARGIHDAAAVENWIIKAKMACPSKFRASDLRPIDAYNGQAASQDART